MRWSSVCAAMLACTACQPYFDQSQTAALPGQLQLDGQPQPACRDFTAPVTAGATPGAGQRVGLPAAGRQLAHRAEHAGPAFPGLCDAAGGPAFSRGSACRSAAARPACVQQLYRAGIGGRGTA